MTGGNGEAKTGRLVFKKETETTIQYKADPAMPPVVDNVYVPKWVLNTLTPDGTEYPQAVILTLAAA